MHPITQDFRPLFFSRKESAADHSFQELLIDKKDTVILDLFSGQKKELFKVRNPKTRLSATELDKHFNLWAEGKNVDQEGVWVYYPWARRMLHILEKAEFVELRTSRNKHKITSAEQNHLLEKKIGIVGLSVGNAVALTLATERICGHLKLADFDTLELSNLNRIKTGLHNIGTNKAILTAREIAEIDPFIEIECYTDGITEQNITQFITENGNLDLLVEECDELNIKILCRNEAKKHRIPVLMETSDKGMLDVERFDLQPDRPILHGLLKDIPEEKLKHISEKDRLPLVLKMVNALNGSKRGKLSLVEIGQTISTWPQLASAVTLGAGVVTDVSRRILLNQYSESGRYYVDLEDIVGDKIPKPKPVHTNPYEPFNIDEAIVLADTVPYSNSDYIAEDIIQEIVNAACQAPSTGNDQPWKWLYRNGRLHLFHDRYRSYSFGDFDQIASNLSFGACYENLLLKSYEAGLTISGNIFPLGDDSILIASIAFYKTAPEQDFEPVHDPQLVHGIFERCTNRNPSLPVPLSNAQYEALKSAAESINGATFHYITDQQQILTIGEIIGACDRVRLLNPKGHHDFVAREMRWTPQDAEKSKAGIDIRTLGLDGAQQAAMAIIKDEDITGTLKDIDGGQALIEVSMKTVSTASAIGIITLPQYSYRDFFRGGMSLQRLWLKAEELGFAVHPLISPFYLFPRVLHGNGAGLDDSEVGKLKELRKKFLDVVPLGENKAEVFLVKLAKAEKPHIKSYRLPLDETLFIINPES
ncbi:hypothetical protein DYBT9275_01422 [Dyadobacter sp. CECT 9275]|uniref:THIF-type NAD/FAD binding fold domain-containing protein n=1 Tax=Dyadobacter helix TaxID=2822344 RepID=A0A916N514_9BACT|nr:Rv1355c family protein [Dyadobacter sp. CECT 9275]CAG4994576.1 hypothetical protein DYBT9275_01422 [Dyadobacter sp. CECT 9275]